MQNRRDLVMATLAILVAMGTLVIAIFLWPFSKPGDERLVSRLGGPYTDVTAAQLTEMLRKKDFVFINTHMPYEGEIPATDAFIPFDQIAQSLDHLPADKAAKIVLYCRSGTMSTTAAKTLVGLGYTHVMNLAGGMRAWQAAGYAISEEQNRK